MRSVIEALYGEFLERDLPPFTRRQIDVEPVRGKAMVFMGMRRAGKTYLCYQRMKDLLDQGVPKAHILYLNFEDDRLYGFSLGDCQTILDVFYRENPSKKEADCHFFFDEIQNIDGWERFIRRILDTERASVYVTGSSARLLSTEIATGLRGRSLTREVFPYSFEEYLRAGGLSGNFRLPGAKTRLLLEGKANAYLETGGFPEVFGCPPDRRREILQSYIDAVILRDVVERHGVRNVEALRALVQQVLCHPATRFSIHKFHRDLQSRGRSAESALPRRDAPRREALGRRNHHRAPLEVPPRAGLRPRLVARSPRPICGRRSRQLHGRIALRTVNIRHRHQRNHLLPSRKGKTGSPRPRWDR